MLWLHLDAAQLLEIDTFPAAVGTDRFGTLSSDLVKAWLADTTVTIKPVLDLTRTDAVDVHDPPGWMTDLVRLRDPGCVFPGCRRPSRACDLDHIDAYLPIDEGGPPARPDPTTSPRSAATTTAPRPTPPGPTTADPTAPTGGPHRPAAPTTSRPPDISDPPIPLGTDRNVEERPVPGAIARMRRRERPHE